MQLGGQEQWHALLVEGTELHPEFRPGSLIFFRPIHHDLAALVEHECIVEIADGRQFVRFLYPEKSTPGLWSLESDFNPRMAAQEVKWASPIRLIQVWRTKPTGNPTESESS